MSTKLAFIKSPWKIASDIGRPVTLLRRGFYGEKIAMRNGKFSFFNLPVGGWLCDADGEHFPCFIANCCLHIIDGGETPEQSAEAMRLLTQLDQKVAT